MGTARWVYNECIQLLRVFKEGKERAPNRSELRQFIINKKTFERWHEDQQWVLDTPQSVRDFAVDEILRALKSNKALKRQHFDMKLRSAKSKSQVIRINQREWNRKTKRGAFGFLKTMSFTEQVPPVQQEVKIQRTWLGEYYVLVPIPQGVSTSESQAPSTPVEVNAPPTLQSRIVSIDPGIRTFATCYAPQSTEVMEWGSGDVGRVYRLCHAADKLHTKINQPGVRHRKRYTMKRAWRKISRKIRRLVDELHKKLCRWLVNEFDYILLPEFNSQDMIKRGRRRLRSKQARALLTWSHYRFKQRLLFKAAEAKKCVLIVNEAYTSKTCGMCGWIHQALGGNKVYQCKQCGFQCDRDFNGARNILLRNIIRGA